MKVTPKEASKILNTSLTTIYRLMKENLLKYEVQAIGGLKLIDTDDLFQVKRINLTAKKFDLNLQKVLLEREK